MRYSKPPVSLDKQLNCLKDRGLKITDESLALHYLSNISYYRLRAYTYPFQDNTVSDHPFVVPVTFGEIIDLYKFDRKLSQLVFGALEKIEIALRTQIIYQWAITNGSHWQIIPALYRDPVRFAGQISSLQTEIDRSNETFIEHYKSKYSTPTEPPSWMSLEVTSFGLLSQIFQNLKKGPEKIAVAEHFGLNDISLLENWMHCFSNIRNICAHHSRLWNRRLTTHIKLPIRPTYPFIKSLRVYPYKVYATFCCMQYILNIVDEGNRFKAELKKLMAGCPLAQEKEMGFPSNWDTEDFWQD